MQATLTSHPRPTPTPPASRRGAGAARAGQMRVPAAAPADKAARAPAAAAASTVSSKREVEEVSKPRSEASGGCERRAHGARGCIRALSHFRPDLLQAASFLAALPALAEESAVDAADAATTAPSVFGFSPIEVAIAVAPLLFYGVLTVYRSAVNPKASISDVAFLLAAFLIVGNLLSGLIFKVRLF